MFDANMRYLPKGKKFFAKVHYIYENLYGIQNGDLLLCEMLSEDNTSPSVLVILQNEDILFTYEDNFYDKLFVYEGCYTIHEDSHGNNYILSNFIDKGSEDAAHKLLQDFKLQGRLQ